MQPSIKRLEFLVYSFLILASLFVYFYSNRQVLDKPFTHDEVDYVVCAEKGIVHNALGKQTLSLKEFITLGRYKANKDTAAIHAYSKQLVDPNEDVFVLRHYHPPLPVYYWSLFGDKDLHTHEKNLRLSVFFLVLFGVLLLVLGLKTLRNDFLAITASMLIWMLFVTSDLFAFSYSSLNFHLFLSLSVVLVMIFLMQYIKSPSFKNLFFLAIGLTIALLSLESALFLFAFMFIAVFLTGKHRVFTLSNLSLLIGMAIVLTFLLWPSFITKGELIKSLGMYFGRIFVNANLEYNEVDYWSNWVEVLRLMPVLLVAILISQLLALIEYRKTKNKFTLIPFIVGWGYCLLMTPFILNKTYVLPGVALLVFASIFYLLQSTYFLTYKLFGGLLVISLLLIISSDKREQRFYSPEEGKKFEDKVKVVDELQKEGRVLIFPGHVYQYYLGKDNIDAIGHPKQNKGKFTYRYAYDRQNILSIIQSGEYKYVIIPKGDRFVEWKRKLINCDFEYSERLDLQIFKSIN